MPKAERGSTKDIANRMKSRGLQRLRFYCQVCERQMRDENGFRNHVASEPHVRAMLEVGKNPARKIGDYSRQFKHDFLQLLRTSHGEKRVNANHFYQQYIAKKDHIHMNSTHWKTLTEFVKSLGREGICRVDINEKGIFVAWIDSSPEALARQEAIRRKDKLDKGDEERTNALLEEQVKRAQEEAARLEQEVGTAAMDEHASSIAERKPEEKIKISFGRPATSTGESVAAPVTAKKSVFSLSKASGKSKPAATSSNRPMSNAQRIVMEEAQRQQWRRQDQTHL
jgi:DNA/RNA-binding protein KIN17